MTNPWYLLTSVQLISLKPQNFKNKQDGCSPVFMKIFKHWDGCGPFFNTICCLSFRFRDIKHQQMTPKKKITLHYRKIQWMPPSHVILLHCLCDGTALHLVQHRHCTGGSEGRKLLEHKNSDIFLITHSFTKILFAKNVITRLQEDTGLAIFLICRYIGTQ